MPPFANGLSRAVAAVAAALFRELGLPLYRQKARPLRQLRQNGAVELLGAFILAGGAFFGVYKGAVYAYQRTVYQADRQDQRFERQLDEESRRLQRQLDAENARLEKQLAHDRWMREVEELRQLVDEAAATGLRAANAIHRFRDQVRWHVEGGKPLNEKYSEKWKEAELAVQAIQGFVERLELRLGSKHDLPVAFTEWQLKLENAQEALDTTPSTKETLRDAGKLLKTSAEKYLDFMKEARKYVALEPPATF